MIDDYDICCFSESLLDAVYDEGVYYFLMICVAIDCIVKYYCDFKIL